MKIKDNEGQLIFKTADCDVTYIQPAMPCRLQIAAQLLAANLIKNNISAAMSSDSLVLVLKISDALIKAHEETK